MINKTVQVVMNGSPVSLDVEINDSSEVSSAKFKCGCEIKEVSSKLAEKIMEQIHWIWK